MEPKDIGADMRKKLKEVEEMHRKLPRLEIFVLDNLCLWVLWMVGPDLTGKGIDLGDNARDNVVVRNTTRKWKKSEITLDIRKKLKQFEYEDSEEDSKMPYKGKTDEEMTKCDKEEIESKLEESKKEWNAFKEEMKNVMQRNKEDIQAEFEKMRTEM